MRKSRSVQVFMLLCCLLTAHMLRAQLTIATDYNTCMQGMKDRNGVWVIEPKYDFIKQCIPNYIVSVNGKFGLIDKNGDLLIPTLYSNLKPLYEYNYKGLFPRYYIADQNGHSGVIDSLNNIIIPIEYWQLKATDDTIVMMKKESDTWYFSNLRGGIFKAPWTHYFTPERVAPHAYTMPTERYFMRRYGMCNDSGRILLEQKYTRIAGDPNARAVRVAKGDDYGYYSNTGKEIWPIEFTYNDRWSYYNPWYNYALVKSSGPARRGDKVGLINMKGETLIPFEYDDIRLFYDVNVYSKQNLWIVSKDSLYGLYDDASGWKIPVECSRIQTVRSYYTRSDSTAVGLLVYQRKDKWGAATSNGQEVLPCIYDEMVMLKEKNGFVFREGDNFMALHLNTSDISLEISDMTYGTFPSLSGYHKSADVYNKNVPENLMFSYFRGHEGVIAFYDTSVLRHKYANYYYPSYFRKGEYLMLTVPDSIAMTCTFYTRPLKNFLVDEPDVKILSADRIESFGALERKNEIIYIPGKSGANKISTISYTAERPGYDYYLTSAYDFVSESGRLIVRGDTVNHARIEFLGANGTPYYMMQHPGSRKYSVVDTNGFCGQYKRKYQVGDYSATHYWTREKYDWILCESTTGANVLPSRVTSDWSAPLWDSVTFIINDDLGMRLYNYKSRKYLTNFKCGDLRPLDPLGNAFAVKTCSGNIGIIDSHGNWITDTLWTALKEINYIVTYKGHTGPIWYLDQDYRYYHRYLLSDAADSSVVYDRYEGIKKTSDMQASLWSTCATQLETERTDLWIRDSLSHIPGVQFYYAPSDSNKLLTWHRKVIIDTVYSSRRFQEDVDGVYRYFYSRAYCHFCAKQGFERFDYEWARHPTQVEGYFPTFISDSLISFGAAQEGFNWHTGGIDYQWCSTVMLFPDGIHNITIDSLFSSTSDWKNFLINFVLDFVNHHNVNGDCHNPVALPGLLADRFLIRDEGIVLFPPGFTYEGGQLELTMPWDVATPYLRNDIRTKLPVNEK